MSISLDRKFFKRSFMVLLCCLVFSAGMVTSVKKASANPLLGAAAIVGGASAGPFVIAGLLVAGGAGLVIGVNDPAIQQKAKEIYDRTSDGFKTTLSQSIDGTKKAVNLTADMWNELDTILNDSAVGVGTWLSTLLKDNESKLNTSVNGLIYTANDWDRSIGGNVDRYLTVNGYVGYKIVATYQDSYGRILVRIFPEEWNTSGSIRTLKTITANNAPDNIAYNAWKNADTPSEIEVYFKSIGITITEQLKNSVVPVESYFNDKMTANVNEMKGFGEFNVPLDQWLSGATTATGQKVLSDAETGNLTLEDGTPVTADQVITPWVSPQIKDGVAVPTFESPAVAGSDVFAKPEAGTDAGTDAGTGDSILQGLWDWLKGILQSILDAILGLAEAIASALATVFIPSEGYFENLFKDIKAKFDLKLPLIGVLAGFFGDLKDATFGENIPEFKIEIPEKWGGGIFSIIDFQYFSDYRDWILNFIRFTAWFYFLRRLYNKLPSIIY